MIFWLIISFTKNSYKDVQSMIIFMIPDSSIIWNTHSKAKVIIAYTVIASRQNYRKILQNY